MRGVICSVALLLAVGCPTRSNQPGPTDEPPPAPGEAHASHLAHIFDKTGTHRQAELVNLLLSSRERG